ncbi:MAG: hypothetical protein IPK82_22460 [Polyangiaceae bacterium]|nr:hypothetical protein [Polyangiaceae bacterium]
MLDDLLSNPWAYMPPRSSLWLWVAGPLLIALIYSLTKASSKERKKRLREADLWRRSLGELRGGDESMRGSPYRPEPNAKKKTPPPAKAADPGPARVKKIPSTLAGALAAVGAGEVVSHFELVRDLAYLSIVEANLFGGSDYQSVSGLLEERGPSFTVRPLPVVDGAHVQNSGVQFKKDPELMEKFLIEGADAKAIGKWLTPSIRRALCGVPSAWLRVQGATMTVTTFGDADADGIDRLVELADHIFAEHGAEGGPSLFGDDEDRAQVEKNAAVKMGAPLPVGATTLNETPSSKKRS